MSVPALLPLHLMSYASYATDQELFQALIHKPDDLVYFFEVACEDEQWALQHQKFLRFVLRWTTKQFYLGHFSLYYVRQIVKSIQSHYSLLNSLLFFRSALFFTMKLNIESQTILINSLLFGVCSPVLGRTFKRECFEKLKDEWTFPSLSLSLFHHLETYITQGEIAELWKLEYAEILRLMRQAQEWELTGLVEDCVVILKRYLQPENVVQTILNAHQQGFIEWKAAAIEFFNQQAKGVFLLSDHALELKMRFLNFEQETLELFSPFAPWITHLAFPGRLSENQECVAIIQRCPKLMGIDLSGSESYVYLFDILSHRVTELSLCACHWLRPEHFRQIHLQLPDLKKLELRGNVHLNYQAWGELSHFRLLRELNLGRCFQLKNEELKVIGRGCTLLSDLNLEECRAFDDKGLLDFFELCPYLQELNLNYCDQLTDKVLFEISLGLPQLKSLNLAKCRKLTDKGVLHLVTKRPTLTYLNVQGCNFSLQVINYIQKTCPFLTVAI